MTVRGAPRNSPAGSSDQAFLIAGFLVWLGPILYGQIVGLVRNLPGYLRALSERYNIELGSLLEQLDSSLRQFQLERSPSC